MRAGPFHRLFDRRLRASFAVACGLVLNGGCEEPKPAPAPPTGHLMQGIPCTDIGATRDLTVYYPEVIRAHATMEALPLTGAGILEDVQAAGVQVCRLAPNDDYYGLYSERTISLVEGVAPDVVAHEYFHAYQRASNDDYRARAILTLRDVQFAQFLAEATSVAYEMVVEREALLQGSGFAHTPGTASSNNRVRETFDTAFASYMEGVNGGDTPDNRRGALQYAGQAVVLFLMAGMNEHWTVSYTRQVSSNAANLPTVIDGSAAGYVQKRDRIFRHLGAVSPGLNLVPGAYLGQGADVVINAELASQERVATRAAGGRVVKLNTLS